MTFWELVDEHFTDIWLLLFIFIILMYGVLKKFAEKK